MESNNGPKLRTPKPSLNSVYGMYLHVPQHTKLADGRFLFIGSGEYIHPDTRKNFFTCDRYKDIPAELFEQVTGLYVTPEDNVRWGEATYLIDITGVLMYRKNNWDSSD